MAQIVVQLVDKTHPDPEMDARQYKRGDVICALPDDHVFSEYERNNPAWRIISVPDMSLSEAQALCANEPGDPKVNRMLQRRVFRLDPGTLGAAAAAATIRTARVQKVALADPRVIGDDDKVIG